jgi:heat-inducible transcriptional repressor
MLSYRARKILLLAVGDYIATGEPVASRGLAERHGVDLSPASVRAVLAELEAAGYLRKPHTSAGRVPTEEGLRLFAEAMVHLSDRTTARDEELARRLSEVALGLDVVLRNASKVLAEMTGSAALLRPPRADAWVLRDLRFLLLRPRELLAVIVSSTGGVEHRVLRVEHTPSPAELDRQGVVGVLGSMSKFDTLVEIFSESTKRYAQSPLFGEKRDGEWQWMTYGAFKEKVDNLRGGLAGLG